jgi:ABC-type transport system involved in multi-copper enzyme maturation permease subunit
MTTMMDGTVSVDPQTKVETVMEGFDNVWQIFGAVSNAQTSMDMGLTSMCNINMMYFAIAVLVCIFISYNFKSGYSKNLFTVRARKTDYVISKTTSCFVGSAIMFIAFFVGAMLGGAIAQLPFSMEGFNVINLIFCMISKIFLCLIFVAVCVLASVVGKSKSWLSLILSFGFGMLFFTMIPMISPLDSTFLNVILSLGGGFIFSLGVGAISNLVLKKTSLV